MTNVKRLKAATESQEAQAERFIAMARELGADESEERFNAKLKKVAGTKLPAAENKPDSKHKQR